MHHHTALCASFHACTLLATASSRAHRALFFATGPGDSEALTCFGGGDELPGELPAAGSVPTSERSNRSSRRYPATARSLSSESAGVSRMRGIPSNLQSFITHRNASRPTQPLPIFSWRSSPEPNVDLESFKCRPLRYLKPMERSNSCISCQQFPRHALKGEGTATQNGLPYRVILCTRSEIVACRKRVACINANTNSAFVMDLVNNGFDVLELSAHRISCHQRFTQVYLSIGVP
jgi:hypothetical protein